MKRTEFKRSSLRIADTRAVASVKVAKPAKLPKCPQCKDRFAPERDGQKFCGGECVAAYFTAKTEKARAAAAKKDRKETKAKLVDLKPLSYFEKAAERACNRYVRLRDHHLACASCDKPATWGGQWHASHYRSVGAAAAVRYHLWNIHKACSVCNKHLSGNLAEYDPRLRARIGDQRVDWLRTQTQVVRYSREYLERLKNIFNEKARRQKKRIDHGSI